MGLLVRTGDLSCYLGIRLAVVEISNFQAELFAASVVGDAVDFPIAWCCLVTPGTFEMISLEKY